MLMLLPETAEAVSEDRPRRMEFDSLLAACFFIAFGWLCAKTRSEKVIVLRDQSVQTVEFPSPLVAGSSEKLEECFYVALRYWKKCHLSRDCRGLSSASEVLRLERCSICG